MTSPPLRPYQAAALAATFDHFAAGRKSALIVSPTGTGKSRLIVEAVATHAADGGRALIVAPRSVLVAQLRAALDARDVEADVHTIQELTRPGARIPGAITMIVFDEARHYLADAWSRLREALPDAIVLAADATPSRPDGRGLDGLCEVLVEAITVADAVAQGYLVPFEVLRPHHALAPNELAQDPVDAFIAHGAGSGVVFAASVELAQEYAARLTERGVTAMAVWGAMPVGDRDRALAEYAAGRIRVLTNAALLCEGWDAPITETVVLARGFGSAGGYLQAVGRGARLYHGKACCRILDLRGVTHIHGEPDAPRTWHLEGKACRRAGDDPNIRFCQVCGSVLMLSDTTCPECGREGTHRLRPPRVLGLPLERFARKRDEDAQQRARTLARWLGLARSKGWREGQAMHRFKAVYGAWPTHEIVSLARSIR